MSTVQQPPEPGQHPIPPGFDPTRDVVRPPLPAAATARPPYQPLSGRAAALTAVLGITVALDIAAVVAGLLEIQLLDRLAAGENVSDAQLDANDTRVGMIALGQTALFWACAICFISWLHRAYSNMGSLAPPNRRHETGWAIGSWFIPFLNLVRPKQIVNDVWHSGRPSDPPPPWLMVWWLAFLVSGFLSRIALRGERDTSSIDAMRDASWSWLASDSVDAVAAILAILVVRVLTRNQQARADKARAERQPAAEPTGPRPA